MTKEISVGIWEKAPFRGVINRGIIALNLLLESKEALVTYKLVPISPKKLAPIDILFFDGGADINPQRYSDRNRSSYFNNARDDVEFELFNFYENKTRMSGACRGHQLINVALGGTLYQDIYNDAVAVSGHPSPHPVKVITNPDDYNRKTNGFLPPFLDSSIINVSSLHHQCLARFGEDLFPTLVWKDSSGHGINEGIESSNGIYRGLQSHPEFGMCKHDGYLFSYLLHVDAFAKDFFKDNTEKKMERNEGRV